MAQTRLMTAITTLAASVARVFGSSGKLQMPGQRRALFEAMEQRFLLSGEAVVPPPPPVAQALPALEAPLNTDAGVLPAGLSASSAPIQYTIQGEQGQSSHAQDTLATVKSEGSDPGGVAATSPTIVATDPSLPGQVVVAGKANEPAAPLPVAASGSTNTADAAVATKTGNGDGVLAPAVLAEPVRDTTAQAPVQMSLSAYAAYVQSRPAPTQVVIVDSTVSNYETLVKSIANYGLSDPAPTDLAQDATPTSTPTPDKQADSAAPDVIAQGADVACRKNLGLRGGAAGTRFALRRHRGGGTRFPF